MPQSVTQLQEELPKAGGRIGCRNKVAVSEGAAGSPFLNIFTREHEQKLKCELSKKFNFKTNEVSF